MARTRYVRYAVLGVALAATCLGAAFVLDLYIVPTDSMRPTLVPGDVVLCVRGFGRDRGDVAVLRSPIDRGFVVKRVVGVPADRLSYVRKALSINGKMLAKNFVAKLPVDDPMDQMFEQSLPGSTFRILEAYGPSLTDLDERVLSDYFVMGDNRDGSIDSRAFGEVPLSAFRCKAVAILVTEQKVGYSFDRVRMLR